MEGQEGDYGWPSEDGRLEEEMQEALDPLLQAHLLGFIELVLQDIAAGVPRGHLREFLEIVQRLELSDRL